MSNLLTHARSELTRAELFDEDSDYGGALGQAVMELMAVFDKQNHSGFSAETTIQLFTRLARFQVISSLTSDPDEWTEFARNQWQSKRQSSVFSRDGGLTWYDISNPENNNGDTWVRDE